MKQLITIFFILIVSSSSAQKSYKQTLKLMGCRFDITVVAKDSIIANMHIDTATAEIKRIEKLISSWDENSQTSQINKYAGIQAVKVDTELFNLIKRSIEISKLLFNPFRIEFLCLG